MSPKDWPLRPLPDSANQLPARLGDFDCGKPSLDAFLKKTALFNQQTGVCRTGICQPAKPVKDAPRARCSSCSGDLCIGARGVVSDTEFS